MKGNAGRAVFLALFSAVCAGCTLFAPVDVETKKYVLSSTPHVTPTATRPATLLLLPPETQAMYDTTQMAYSVRPFELDYFSRNEWAETPSQMMRRLLVQTLEDTHYFSAVLTPPYAGRSTHTLRTEILELRQDFTSGPPMLRLAVRFQLSADIENGNTKTKQIAVAEPITDKSPQAGVAAANEAVAKLLRELAEFIVGSAG